MDQFERYFNDSLASVYKYLGVLSLTKADSFGFMMIVKNLTTFTQPQLLQYAADYFQFKAINLIWWYTALSIAVSCGLLGMFGYIVEAVILTDKEFNTPSFLYHKGLVFFEFIQAVCYSTMYCIRFVDGFVEPYLTMFNNIVAIDEIGAMAAIWIAIFMSAERLVALFIPAKFHKVNKRRYANTAIFISFVLSLHYLPDLWAPTLNVYPAYWTFKLYRENVITVECCILAIMSLAVGLGLYVRGRQQFKIDAEIDVFAKERFQLNKQLCVLSICCSIPFFIEKFLYSVSYTLSPIVCPITLQDVLLADYKEAQNKLDINRISCHFYFLHAVAAGIAHNSHLYCYLLFSKRFQQAALKMFKKARGKVQPIVGQSQVGLGMRSRPFRNITVSASPSASEYPINHAERGV